MSGHGQTAESVERHAVRSWLAPTVGNGAFVAARLQKDADALAGSPAANGVRRNVGKEQTAVDPYGAFNPCETRGHALQLGVGGDDAIARSGILPVYIEGRNNWRSLRSRLPKSGVALDK